MHSGKLPDQPYAAARILSTKVAPEFHRRIRQYATDRDATVSAVIKAALVRYMAEQAQ